MRIIKAALWLAAVTALAEPPTPEAHFGHKLGEDRKMVPWSRVVSYFQALEKTSDRIRVRELGRSTEGRPFVAAWISSPATLQQLDRYQQMQTRLADPRQTSETDAARMIGEGKAVVMITCSIHATEVASTMTAAEFAYRMLMEESPKYRAILDNVILILVPSLNPDGVDIVGDWYRSTLGTPYEGTAPPRLYHKYTGHDNNRDWYLFSQAETKLTVAQLHNVWHPQIVYDVHQMGANAARMFVPPWLDPIDPNVDPVIAQMSNAFGAGMAMDLTAAGKKGVSINSTYDFWTPARHYQSYHGGIRILSESASARIATPVTVKPEEISQNALGYSPRARSWNYLEPWLGGEWRLRDIMDYQGIAWESLLYQAAVRREDLLRNFYNVGKRSVARTSPGAFVVPFEQRDPEAARKMLETLSFGQVEVERSGENYVIRMQQPYSSFAKTLLERQDYPDLREYPGGPPRRPYDVTAHTLPLLMGVTARAVESWPAPGEKSTQFNFTGRKLAASDGDTWREVNRIWSARAAVWRDPATGDFSAQARAGWAEKKRPRVALYRSHVPVMDEGWTRWTLEQFGFVYSNVGNAEILAGKLRARFDAILFPDQSASSINNGFRPDQMPAAYTGGLGDAGAKELEEFARQGGTLIFLNDSTNFALGHMGVPLKNVLSGVPNRSFYCPGSLLRVTLDAQSPLAHGLPREIAIWSEQSPAWEIPASSGARTVARYVESGVLASGWLLGENYLAGKTALAEVPLGDGRVVLFGMRPQYRGQSLQAMKLLFNALVM